ncbi:hypothetical protein DEQ92_20375 [Haloferax sp. Atlit-6N]|uniref:hypothetical protein n=1 Tax=Haloferax sp. Atlit-6N TaxID=2077205 RepID=UPI000E269858|nr:hypothetical protein [Haloferax sp. Atlit-6N]REA00212.1 hypothetical protein DEQ92_20375 [Haloferax sp. Atlit-6N]
MSDRVSVDLHGDDLHSALQAAGAINKHRVQIKIDTTGDEAACHVAALNPSSTLIATGPVPIRAPSTADGVETTVAVDFGSQANADVDDVDWFEMLCSALDDEWCELRIDRDQDEQTTVTLCRDGDAPDDERWGFVFETAPAPDMPTLPDVNHTQHIEADGVRARGVLYSLARETDDGVVFQTEADSAAFTASGYESDGGPELLIGHRTRGEGAESAVFGCDFVQTVAEASPAGETWRFHLRNEFPMFIQVGDVTWAIAPQIKGLGGRDD